MKTFKDFYILNEGRFRDSKKLIHKLDVPMFSIFLDSKNGDYGDDILWNHEVSKVFELAKKRINKLGFPSMHVNVVFRKYDEDEKNTKGMAHGNPEASRKYKSLKQISLNYNFLSKLVEDYNDTSIRLIGTIVHEWSHIWMFNNGKQFRNAIGKYHEALLHSNSSKLSGDLVDKKVILQKLSDLVKFTGGYGLTNPDEVWATAIQKFNTLHPYHRKRIFELMQERGPRELPNKRMQKHLKVK